MSDAILTHQPTGKEKFQNVEAILEHTAAIKVVLSALTHPKHWCDQNGAGDSCHWTSRVHGGKSLAPP